MQTLTLFHSESFPIGKYRDALSEASIASQSVPTLDQLASEPGALRVILVDPAINNGRPSSLDGRTAIVGIGLDEEPKWLGEETIYIDLPSDPSQASLLRGVKRAYQSLHQKRLTRQIEQQLGERTRELRELSEVGIALSTERDHSVLLTTILTKARELSRSDAGSLYLLDEVDGEKMLRWKLAQNDSIQVEGFEEMVLPITRRSLAGWVALTGDTLVIDDAYSLPPDAEYSINRSFDEKTGYLTRSILVFPMVTHVGELVGVLQLINRRKPGAPPKLTAATVPDHVVPFHVCA
jgi:hypothetical protein